jgi:hypothetical protein
MLGGLGYTAPCKEGIIFCSNKYIDPEETKFFDDFTRAKFSNWLNKRDNQNNNNSTSNHSTGTGNVLGGSSCSNNGQQKCSIEPIAFFQLNESTNYTTSHQLMHAVQGKYILIKLIRPVVRDHSRIPFNIDLQYVGFRGFAGQRSISFGNLN